MTIYGNSDEWRKLTVDQFAQAKSVVDVTACTQQALTNLGFDFFSYAILTRIPHGSPSFALISSLPKAWHDLYLARQYFKSDPSVQRCRDVNAAHVWPLPQTGELSPYALAAHTHSINYGWSMPFHGLYGTISIFSLIRQERPISSEEHDQKSEQMAWLARLVHFSMQSQLMPTLLPSCYPPLTSREQEVLQWAAAGKTYGETAIILAIEPGTVKFHLSNARRKLGAANKIEAVLKAAVMGVLYETR